ncbi:MAG: S4 domain-containing protein, partial [Verrucomicrobiota bacterium]
FTFLGRDEISALEAQHQADPGKRVAHRALARAMTELIHGAEALEEAVRASEILFSGGTLEGLSEGTFNELVGEIPTRRLETPFPAEGGIPVVDIFVASGLCPSKGQGRKDLEGGGLYLNNHRVAEVARLVTSQDLLFGRHLLLRKGRKNYVVMTIGG